jgi:hypothetical protein
MAERRKRPTSILRLKVKGPHIKPGRIPVPELLVICKHAQDAVNRQADVIRGKPGVRPGPVPSALKVECTLEVFSIGRGSAVVDFAGPEPIPSPQQPLDLGRIESLGETAVREIVTALRASKKARAHITMDVGVKRSLQEMGGLLNNGVSSIEWIAPAIRGKRSRIAAMYDEDVRDRLGEAPAQKGKTKPVSVDGRLEMADFQTEGLKCIIHTASKRIPCSFSSDLEDDVYAALRHIARVAGKGTINPKTKQIDEIDLASVVVLDPSMLEREGFFATPTLEQLTKEQGVDPTFDIRTLRDAWPDDEDVDKFLAAIENAAGRK